MDTEQMDSLLEGLSDLEPRAQIDALAGIILDIEELLN